MTPSLQSKSFLRVKITQIDYSLIQPGPLDNSLLPLAPVIRIFGSSSVGERTCLYVHQVYPYFFIEYHGKLTASHGVQTRDEGCLELSDLYLVNRHIYKLKKSLNHAIALSLKRDPLSPNTQYIRAVLLVKGIHFYGFHSSYSPFLKIYLVDPGHVRRAAALLQSGIVMGTKFLVFESHLSFVLQFMCDFGLYGCGWIDVENVLQRDIQSTLEGDFVNQKLSGQPFKSSPYLRQTRMPMEADAIAPGILNRRSISARKIHHQLRIPAEPLPTEPLIVSVRELWDDERSRRTSLGLGPTPTISVDSRESARNPGCDWVAEAEYWVQIREKIEADRAAQPPPPSTINGWDNWVMTTFESIEALWEEKWKVWKPSSQKYREADAIFTNCITSSATEDISRSEWDAPDQSTDYEDIDAIDVDILKLKHGLTELMDHEKWEEFEAEEPNVGLEESEDESHQEEEIQDVEIEVFDPAVSSDPFKVPEHTSNQLSPTGGEFRLSSPPERLNRKCDVPSPTTPTRIHWAASSSRPFELDGDSAPIEIFKVQSDLMEVDQRLKSTKQSRALLEDSVEDLTAQSCKHISAQKRNAASTSCSCLLPSLRVNNCRPIGMTMNVLKESYTVPYTTTASLNQYKYSLAPPSLSILRGTMDDHGLHLKVYQSPYYSSLHDIPERPKEYAGLVYHIKGGHGITHLHAWVDDGNSDAFDVLLPSSPVLCGWEYSSSPPSNKEIRRWLIEDEKATCSKNLKLRSQVELVTFLIIIATLKIFQIQGTTPANIYGFIDTPNSKLLAKNLPRVRQTMSILGLEVFAPTCGARTPNVEIDPIAALSLVHQIAEGSPPYKVTIIIRRRPHDRVSFHEGAVELVDSEMDLINKAVDIVSALDPDIVTGWDVQRGSWGYLNARSKHHGQIFSILSTLPY
ncbi:hypothetical protein C0993_005137 [Termitomyces sp. T159_Od127]|nr:hypothetical protein C0993_005137 [Termitomyces sp. T159_Od127]